MIKLQLLTLIFSLLTVQICQDPNATRHYMKEGENEMKSNMGDLHPYVGMWMTEDGYIRHELLPNGRYDESRGDRKNAYQGSYTIEGDHIEYVDDTGFTADGDFIDEVLYHAGMVLKRVK